MNLSSEMDVHQNEWTNPPKPAPRLLTPRKLLFLIVALLIGGGTAAISLLDLGARRMSKHAIAGADIRMLATQLKAFEMVSSRLPTQAEGLQALVTRPGSMPSSTRWNQLMTEVPRDPWGRPYAYRFPAVKSTATPYDLFSHGPDGWAGTPDDIGNWSP